VYFHNRSEGVGGHFVTLRLEGTKSNRDGVGAVITIVAGSKKQVSQRFGGGSYQSAADHRLHFGLGKTERIESINVHWPSGQSDHREDLPVDKFYHFKEGDSVAKSASHAPRSAELRRN
jgi:enediyne biosynthesis protein E4